MYDHQQRNWAVLVRGFRFLEMKHEERMGYSKVEDKVQNYVTGEV